MDSLESTYLAVLSLALLSGMTTLIGVSLALYLGKHTRGIAFGIGFSAGIMLLVSIFELIPGALASTGHIATFLAVSVGALLVAMLHWIIPHTHLVEERGVFDYTLSGGPIW
jgi:zinc transporter, ZIP family